MKISGFAFACGQSPLGALERANAGSPPQLIRGEDAARLAPSKGPLLAPVEWPQGKAELLKKTLQNSAVHAQNFAVGRAFSSLFFGLFFAPSEPGEAQKSTVLPAFFETSALRAALKITRTLFVEKALF